MQTPLGTDSPRNGQCMAGDSLVRGRAGIAETHGHCRQALEVGPHHLPSRLQGQRPIQQSRQVMRPGKGNGVSVQNGLQILFRTLLRVEAHRVIIRRLSDAEFSRGGGQVGLGLFDPFASQGIHRERGPSR